MIETIRERLRETARVLEELPEAQLSQIAKAAELMIAALRAGRKIIWFGNGGSATQSQHMAAEFVGRFAKERKALPSISLTENMASVTAIANDYAFEGLFARQLEGLATGGDVAVALSTSGHSPNVIAGVQAAKTLRLGTVALTGGSGGPLASRCDVCVLVPSTVTARIQEAHLAIGHILCELVEDTLFPSEPAASPVGAKAR